MIFRDKNNDGFYKAKGKGFNFTLSYSINHKAFYVVATHNKKDIRLNTLWINKTFKTFELGVKFCETFDYKKYKCIGGDV